MAAINATTMGSRLTLGAAARRLVSATHLLGRALDRMPRASAGVPVPHACEAEAGLVRADHDRYVAAMALAAMRPSRHG